MSSDRKPGGADAAQESRARESRGAERSSFSGRSTISGETSSAETSTEREVVRANRGIGTAAIEFGSEPDFSRLADVSRLEDILDRNALLEVCRSFFELFSIPIRVFSRDGTLLADVHEEQAVCVYVNSLMQGRRACNALVTEVRRLDPETNAVDHPCFTGAVYRVVPMVYQGRRLGRFVVGPYVPAELREVPRSLVSVDPEIERQKARDSLAEMPRARAQTVERITEHLRRVLDLILFSGHRAYLTSEMHVASVRESYRELAEKNASLQEAYDKLKELDRLKSNFLATVSHELRISLTSIIGYSDMLAAGIAGDLNGEQREFVDTIRSKGDHLLALITSLLDMNKLEQGNLPLNLQRVDIGALVQEVAKTVLPQASKKQIRVEFETHGVRAIHADPMRLKQVLFNLTENAIKFTPIGGRVVLGAKNTELDDHAGDDFGAVLMAAPKRAVELTVTDSGMGIPEEARSKIFDAFYQVDGSSTREHGGTGLGLSIVKRLIEAHGGRVEVESELEQGSTFRCIVPDAEDT